MTELEKLTLSDIHFLLDCLDYSRMNIGGGSAPYGMKKPKLEQLESVVAKLRALRDDMKSNP